MSRALPIRLRGPSGEPVDFRRTCLSHGVASLPPMRVDDAGGWFEVALPLPGMRSRSVRVEPGRRGWAEVMVMGPPLSDRASSKVEAAVRGILNLDLDLSSFYALATDDPELAWVTDGAGRMIRSPTVFEEVVKTICTTNCSWSATTMMVGRLVDQLGEEVVGRVPAEMPRRAFPTPEAMAEQPEEFYRESIRAGYRSAYLVQLARGVSDGDIDIESLTGSSERSDEDVKQELLALPGVGPYAAAHIMLMLGRYSDLILDSWTRPKYARLRGKKEVGDPAIVRRFRRYGPYAGLAFWLYVTSDWV